MTEHSIYPPCLACLAADTAAGGCGHGDGASQIPSEVFIFSIFRVAFFSAAWMSFTDLTGS